METDADAISEEFRGRIRDKMNRALELALDTVMEGMKDPEIKTRLYAARMVMPLAPNPNHGAMPVTLILPGIPRPKVIEGKVGGSLPLPKEEKP